MKVMLVGEQQGAEAFLAALWELPDLGLVSFADRAAAEAELAEHQADYDWVLLDGRELCTPRELLERRLGQPAAPVPLDDGQSPYVYEYHAAWVRGCR